MERRTVLKLVALTAFSQKLNAFPDAAPYKLQFFTEEEIRLLDQLMELIIPADDHSPGAHDAGTNLFADLMVAAGGSALQQQWRDGLRLMRGQPTVAGALRTAAAGEENPKTDLERFFVVLKQMTVNGYYTSAIGIHQEMEYVGNTYLAAYPECTHPEHR